LVDDFEPPLLACLEVITQIADLLCRDLRAVPEPSTWAMMILGFVGTPAGRGLRAFIIPFRAGVASKHQPESNLGLSTGIPLTVQRGSRSVRAGARDNWCTMREELASYSFLAVTVGGLVLLCSGLVALVLA
jgi:hypothetical protein